MGNLVDDLGEYCSNNVSELLEELIVTVINSAKEVTDNEEFARYRRQLNDEYADAIYRCIMRYKRIKRSKK